MKNLIWILLLSKNRFKRFETFWNSLKVKCEESWKPDSKVMPDIVNATRQENEICAFWDAQGPMHFLTSACRSCAKDSNKLQQEFQRLSYTHQIIYYVYLYIIPILLEYILYKLFTWCHNFKFVYFTLFIFIYVYYIYPVFLQKSETVTWNRRIQESQRVTPGAWEGNRGVAVLVAPTHSAAAEGSLADAERVIMKNVPIVWKRLGVLFCHVC